MEYVELQAQNAKLKKLLKSVLDKDISVNQKEKNERNARFDLWVMENKRTMDSIRNEWDFFMEIPTTVERVKYIHRNYTDSLLLARHVYELLLDENMSF